MRKSKLHWTLGDRTSGCPFAFVMMAPFFLENALKAAATVFYKENSENDHFRLGLSICDTLCRKQDGTLALRNGENGGACVVMSIAATVSGRIDNG